MPFALGLVLIVGAAGSFVAIFGLATLSSTREVAVSEQRRRTAKYLLAFGTGLMLLSMAIVLRAYDAMIPSGVALAGSLGAAALAVLRYRPRAA